MSIVAYKDTNLPTVTELRNRWCFGLSLMDMDNNVMADDHIQQAIDSAIKRVERHLGIYLKPTVIATNAEERGLVKGEDYEISEPAMDYVAKTYANWGFLQLRERPAIKLNGAKLVLPNGQVIVDFMTRPEWIKFYPKAAQLHIVPYAGDPTIFALLGGTQSGYPFITGQINSNMPQMWYVDYVAGYDIGAVPSDIRDIVAKLAAIDILGIAGEAVQAGVSSSSISVDGFSQSRGTTVSANSTLYQAHINQFQTEVDKFFDEKDGGARSAERGITFRVL